MIGEGWLDRVDAWLDARLTALKAGFDGWFTRPETDAAGRAGLDRIVYALFYLWFLSTRDIGMVARLLALDDYGARNVRLARAIPGGPPIALLEALEGLLVAALALLLVGLWVRAAAAAVLLLGTTIEAHNVAVDGEHATVFLAFYIPLFTLVLGLSGRTYAVDAVLRRRRGGAWVEPSDSSWTFALQSRALLVILAALFFSSGYFKVSSGGTWLENPAVLANYTLVKNIQADLAGLPTNPMAPYIATTPLAHRLMRDVVLAFEFGFVLVLVPRLRSFFLSLSLVFHGVNATMFGVSFTPVLIAYAPFLNWEAAARRLRLSPRAGRWIEALPSSVLLLGSIGLAAAIGLAWNRWAGVRAAFNLGGLLRDRAIWLVITPLAFAWWVSSLIWLLRWVCRGLLAAGRRPGVETP